MHDDTNEEKSRVVYEERQRPYQSIRVISKNKMPMPYHRISVNVVFVNQNDFSLPKSNNTKCV